MGEVTKAFDPLKGTSKIPPNDAEAAFAHFKLVWEKTRGDMGFEVRHVLSLIANNEVDAFDKLVDVFLTEVDAK